MNWDRDDAVDLIGMRLRAIEPPATGFDAERAVRAGRRSRRRQRLAAAATLAVVGVAAAISVTGGSSAPAPEAYTIRTPTVATLAPQPPDKTLACDRTPLEMPAGTRFLILLSGDPTGRYLLGHARGSSRDSDQRVLWHDGKSTVLDKGTDWFAVNSSGVVVGRDYGSIDGDPPVPRILRDGVVRDFTVPSGYASAVPTAINDNGDVFGTLLRDGALVPGDVPNRFGYNLHSGSRFRDLDLVFWPAGQPDKPVVVADTGEAEAVGFGSNGRMYANVTDAARNVLPYVWDRNLTGAPLPLPADWAGFHLLAARGDHLYGRVAPRAGGASPSASSSGEPGMVPEQTGLTRWNTRTGRADVVPWADDLLGANAKGWLVVRSGLVSYVLIGPDGTAAGLPSIVSEGWPDVQWISDDGKTMLTGAGLQGKEAAVVRCR